MIAILKQKIKNIIHKTTVYRCKKNQVDGTVWLSLGENCLPDDILQRFYLKSYSSPFSSGRSNIDYILQMHLDNYQGLLVESNTEYGYVSGEKVLRSTIYNKCSTHFHNMHINGFEFTHHDWIKEPELKRTLLRRIQRMTSEIGRRNVIFLYHHRFSENSNMEETRKKSQKLAVLFSSEGFSCTVILFYQKIISTKKERALVQIKSYPSILEYELRTRYLWEGDNQRVFWAKNDNDLLKLMLDNAKQQFFN